MTEAIETIISDHQLIQAAQAGQPEALKALVRRFHPRLIKCIRYHAGNNAPIEDLAQDCWYAILSQLQHLQLQISFNAFVQTIARRRTIDWIRKEQRNRSRCVSEPVSPDSPAPMQKTENAELQLQRIHEGVLQLPPTQRLVLSMFYLEGRSLKDIARQLQISEGTVKSRLFYAREALKQLLAHNDGGVK